MHGTSSIEQSGNACISPSAVQKDGWKWNKPVRCSTATANRSTDTKRNDTRISCWSSWDSDDQGCLVSGRRHVAGNVSSVRSSVSNRKEIQITPLKYSMTKVQIYNLLKYFFLKNKYAGHVYYFCLLILQGLFDISSRSLSLLTLRRG
jgi:hypothetical protein